MARRKTLPQIIADAARSGARLLGDMIDAVTAPAPQPVPIRVPARARPGQRPAPRL